jgi:hypothetical protein
VFFKRFWTGVKKCANWNTPVSKKNLWNVCQETENMCFYLCPNGQGAGDKKLTKIWVTTEGNFRLFLNPVTKKGGDNLNSKPLMACFIIPTSSLLQCLQQTMYYNGYKHRHTPILGYVQTTHYGLQGIRTLLASSQEPTGPMECLQINTYIIHPHPFHQNHSRKDLNREMNWSQNVLITEQ